MEIWGFSMGASRVEQLSAEAGSVPEIRNGSKGFGGAKSLILLQSSALSWAPVSGPSSIIRPQTYCESWG